MWLDDDGEDDPTPGPVPDPSERLWRHPSEVAAERAMAAAGSAGVGDVANNTIPLADSGSGSGSILWPITVVGGSIAVAAFGFLGLYTMGAPTSSTSARAGSIPLSSIDGVLPPAAVQPRTLSSPTTGASLTALSDIEGNDSAGGKGGLAATTTTVDFDFAAADLSSGEPTSTTVLWTTTTSVATADSADRAEQGLVDPEDSAPYSNDRGDSGADPVDDPVVGGQPGHGAVAIYPGPDGLGPPLASYMLVDGHILSSAGALGGHSTVFLRIGAEVHEATVTGTDPLTDVAVVTLTDQTVVIDLPTSEVAAVPDNSSVWVSIGYCGDDYPPPVCDAVDPNRDDPDSDGPDSDNPNANSSNSTKPDRDNPDPDVPGPEEQLPEPNGATAGKVEAYISTLPHGSLSGHTFYNTVYTTSSRQGWMAGAPMRDERGRVVGMVVGADNDYVFAVPIDKAVEAARTLRDRGVGSLAWIGVDARATSDGLRIDAIDERSPLAEALRVGDTLVKIDGELLAGRDHLMHLVRNAGVGTTIDLCYFRDTRIHDMEVEILEIPSDD